MYKIYDTISIMNTNNRFPAGLKYAYQVASASFFVPFFIHFIVNITTKIELNTLNLITLYLVLPLTVWVTVLLFAPYLKNTYSRNERLDMVDLSTRIYSSAGILVGLICVYIFWTEDNGLIKILISFAALFLAVIVFYLSNKKYILEDNTMSTLLNVSARLHSVLTKRHYMGSLEDRKIYDKQREDLPTGKKSIYSP